LASLKCNFEMNKTRLLEGKTALMTGAMENK
jgi:hypothetical protein